MTDYILGLDLGPNSIGWALIEASEGPGGLTPIGFLDTSSAGHPPMGVRVFEAGLQNFDTGKEMSKSAARRTARSMRKTLARRRARRRDSLRVLTEAGLLPTNAHAQRELWKRNPYQLRAEALSRPLSDHELGRALYHMAQRRGFKSNRLSEDAKEESALLKEMSELQGLIDESGLRTLGEYLYEQSRKKVTGRPVRLRARQARMDLYADAPRRTRRSMYEEEFAAILDRQAELHGGPRLTSEQRDALHRALFFQHDFRVDEERRRRAPARANLHRAPEVRPCPLEPDEHCCERGEWLAQRFRILKEVRNLKLSECHEPERPLTAEESNFVVETLSTSREVKFETLASKLAKQFGLRQPVEFNLARGGRGALKGNELENALANAFGKRAWGQMDEPERAEIRSLMRLATSEEELAANLQASGLNDEKKLGRLLKFRPKDRGYLGFSLKALERIVPEMEAGLDEYAAITKCYPRARQDAPLPALPSLVALDLDKDVAASVPNDIRNDLVHLANPIVRRALVEVRKVVNALIREHGVPRRVHVEMAREVKQGKKARQEVNKRRAQREKHREVGRAFLHDLTGGSEWPRRSDVDRWILWKEQREQCPYCGKPIPVAALLTADAEVDHILPRHRSLDDSLNNKVLCCSNCNMAKGNRTPLEWRGRESDETVAMLKRVRTCEQSPSHPHGMPHGKTRRFEAERVDTDDFVARQLNDTRYISRLVTKYLLLLYPHDLREGQKAVQTSSGGLTARLRREWGLNGIIPPLVKEGGEVVADFLEHEGWTEKLRIDHRHHAVDALVVALSSRAAVKRLADQFEAIDEARRRPPEFPLPWDGLREDATRHVDRILVSHRPSRRVRGALHEETFFGRRKDGDYVTRKRLEVLTPKMIPRIVDGGVRRAIEARLRECGWSGEGSLPKDWCAEELFLPTVRPKFGRQPRAAHPIRRVRVRESFTGGVELGDNGHRIAKTGGNYCLRVRESDQEGRPEFQVVPRFHAQRIRAEKPGVQRFHSKDSVLIDVEGLSAPVLAVVQKISGPTDWSTQGIDIFLRDACDSRKATISSKDPLRRISSAGAWAAASARRVEVDPLGRVAHSARSS